MNTHWGGLDPHLEELRGRVQLGAPAFVPSIEVGGRATYVVRGPRQVGKSTGLKLLAERAYQSGLDGRQVIDPGAEREEGPAGLLYGDGPPAQYKEDPGPAPVARPHGDRL